MCSPLAIAPGIRLGVVAAALVAHAGAAAAEGACPVAADLRAGIHIAYEDGSHSRFVAVGAGAGADGKAGAVRVVEDAYFDDSFTLGYRYVTVAGLFPVESYDIVDGAVDVGSRSDTTYPAATDGFPAPAAGLEWQAEAMVRSARDGDFAQRLSLSVGPPRPAAYGPCRYEVLPVRLRFQDEVSDSEEQLDFVVALGIAVYRAGGTVGQDYDVHDPVMLAREAPPGMPPFSE
ncbi:MAG: hypothetical protein IT545_15490 [Rhodobacteraceae bacterium]|nr:hypothetical protein [Paracoccaceae bacterium]